MRFVFGSIDPEFGAALLVRKELPWGVRNDRSGEEQSGWRAAQMRSPMLGAEVLPRPYYPAGGGGGQIISGSGLGVSG